MLDFVAVRPLGGSGWAKRSLGASRGGLWGRLVAGKRGARMASTSDVPPGMMEALRPLIPTRPRLVGPPPPREEGGATSAGINSPVRHIDAALVCSELDMMGELHVCGSRILKSALCSSLGLMARDLRKLDGTLRDQLPVILVRDSAILVNIDSIRAIIKHDGVILFEDLDLDRRMKQHEFMLLLQGRIREYQSAAGTDRDQKKAPFEFLVLETVLQRTLQSLQDDYDAMTPEIEEHLRALENIVHWERLKVLLTCKKRIAVFQERVNNVRDCIKELLESDADMADMYLSDKAVAKHKDRPSYAHEEIELLLENYLKMSEEIASHIQILWSNMNSTEDIVNIGLVGQRNELLLLELKLGIGTFAASMGGFGASILGMNLPNSFEQSPVAFWAVLGCLLSVASTSFVMVWRRLLRLVHRKI